MAFFSGAFAVGVGLLTLGGLLIPKRRQQGEGLGEDTPPTISTRGVYVPMIRGTRMTTDIINGWSKITQVNNEDSGGKNFSGGESGSGGPTYRAQVWHILSVGPCDGLFEIRLSGKVKWQGNLTPDTTPSGTEISTGNIGSFRIYWGEPDQPINELLSKSNKVGVASRWPGICYVVWDTMRYGNQAVQPQVDYVLRGACPPSQSLDGSEYIITTPVATGVNPAHLLLELMNSGPFTGSAIPASALDESSLEQFGIDSESDGLPVNVAYLDGVLAETAVQNLLSDFGILIPERDGRIMVVPMRYDAMATYPSLSDDLVQQPGFDREIVVQEADAPSNPVFFIKDETDYHFRDQDVSLGGGAGASVTTGLINSERSEITSVTNINVASEIARRRRQETAVDRSLRPKVLRGLRVLTPGQSIVDPDIGQLLVFGVSWSDEKPETELICSPDTYRIPDTDEIMVVPSPDGDEGFNTADADIEFAIIQLPASLESSPYPELRVFRWRAHSGIIDAILRVSTQPSSDYLFTGGGDGQTHSQGGYLDEAIDIATASPIDTGPKIEPVNDDMAEVLDLSSDAISHAAGRQLMLVNGEVFFVQYFDIADEMAWTGSLAVTVDDFIEPTMGNDTGLRYKASGAGSLVTGGTEPAWPTEVGETVVDGNVTWTAHRMAWIPRNMIRAQWGTSAATHAIGSSAFVADYSRMLQAVHPAWGTGVTAYLKTAPRTTSETVDISTVTAESLVLT